jgi:hypothetical protein
LSCRKTPAPPEAEIVAEIRETERLKAERLRGGD